MTRARWAAIGAAVAVTLGAGSIGLVHATTPSNAVTYIPINPCRLVDTRSDSAVGTKTTPWQANETYTVSAHGDNGNCTAIPDTAAGLQLNVTAIGATQPTFLTLYPFGSTRPTASSLNPVPGAPPTPNSVTTGLSVSGKFDVYNLQGNVNVIIDVVGYYTNHHHDERYMVAAGYVRADATVVSGRNINAQSVTYVDNPTGNTDHYEITFSNGVPFSYSNMAAFVTAACPGADASVVEGTGEDVGKMLVYIEITGNDDTLGPCGFSFNVVPVPTITP